LSLKLVGECDTESNHKFNISSNLLGRDFNAEKPIQKWAGPSRDVALQCTVRQWTSATFGRARAGCSWRLTIVLGPMADKVSLLELHSQRVIGWAVSNRMKRDLA